jgi:hypothetical protein
MAFVLKAAPQGARPGASVTVSERTTAQAFPRHYVKVPIWPVS